MKYLESAMIISFKTGYEARIQKLYCIGGLVYSLGILIIFIIRLSVFPGYINNGSMTEY